jgi:hypothetical protein
VSASASGSPETDKVSERLPLVGVQYREHDKSHDDEQHGEPNYLEEQPRHEERRQTSKGAEVMQKRARHQEVGSGWCPHFLRLGDIERMEPGRARRCKRFRQRGRELCLAAEELACCVPLRGPPRRRSPPASKLSFEDREWHHRALVTNDHSPSATSSSASSE